MIKKRLKLLENGLCFIIQSIKHIEQSEKMNYDSEKELKYSCLCLFSGISLILKERLSQEHWSLLFSDINKANKRNLETGNFYSVNFSDCQNRLSEIVSIKFKDKDNNMLCSLRTKRNKIEHYFENESLISFKSTLACNLNFILNFIDKYLKSNLSNDYKKDMKIIKDKCFKLGEFVKQRLSSIKPELNNQKVILYCSQCNQKAIILCDDRDMNMKCLFCSRIIRHDQYDIIYLDSFTPNITRTKDWLCIGNTFCNECEAENSLVETQDKKEYFCLYCHKSAKQTLFTQCYSCGVTYQNEDEFGRCLPCVCRLLDKP